MQQPGTAVAGALQSKANHAQHATGMAAACTAWQGCRAQQPSSKANAPTPAAAGEGKGSAEHPTWRAAAAQWEPGLVARYGLAIALLPCVVAGGRTGSAGRGSARRGPAALLFMLTTRKGA